MERTTRRAILAASAAAVAAQAIPAKATTGDPLILGRENQAGQPTVLQLNPRLYDRILLTLRGNADSPILRVENSWSAGDGRGLDVQAEGATGIRVASATGTALLVEGPAVFSRSGRAIIRSGRDRVRVEGVALQETSAVLATLQADLGDVLLKAAIPDAAASAISLRLSASAPIDAAVAWFVLD